MTASAIPVALNQPLPNSVVVERATAEPGYRGLDFLTGRSMELLRRLRQRTDLPVIFLTARSSDIDKVAGLQLGARQSRRPLWLKRRCSFYPADGEHQGAAGDGVGDDAAVEAAIRGADTVINLVGILSQAHRQTFTAIHEDGAHRVAEVVRHHPHCFVASRHGALT